MNNKEIILSMMVIVGSAILGLIMLVLAYFLPVDIIAENIGRGMEPMLMQGSEYWYAVDYTETILDNQTDALMLSESLFKSGNSIEDAINVPHYTLNNSGEQLYSLMGVINGDDLSDASIENYPRYWHGYVALLKPFFMIFDYSDWKIFNQSFQLILLCIVIVLIMERNISEILLGFIPMMIIWNPSTIGVSLQYAACFYLSICGVIAVLMKCKKCRLLFLILGILTAYFDYLTYPIVTLFIPLIFLIVFDESKCKPLTLKESTVLCMNWGSGYLGMWAMKWVIGSLITGNNIIVDAFQTIISRTSSSIDGEKITRIGTLYKLVNATFFKWPYVILITAVLIVIVIKAVLTKRKQMYSRESIMQLFIIGFVPIVWFFLTANHANIHPRLVYRCWGIVLMAWFVLFDQVCNYIKLKKYSQHIY